MARLVSGLVSVSFRTLSPDAVIELVARGGLSGIEWGGDIHVPHGNSDVAGRVGRATRSAGLEVLAYGSYYRVGADDPDEFRGVLDSALAIEAPIIRVWAGPKVPSLDLGAEAIAAVYADAVRIADMAAVEGLALVFEWHDNSLTDRTEAAAALLAAADRPNVGTYWQQRKQRDLASRLRDMDTALPYLRGLHMSHLDTENDGRLPLCEGRNNWIAYLEKALTAPGDHILPAQIEFVKDDDPEQFLRDAECLKDLLASVEG